MEESFSDKEVLPALQGEQDRYLTDEEKERLANGGGVSGEGFFTTEGSVSPQTLFQLRQANAEKHILRRQARQLAELEGFVEAHRDKAEMIYGAKIAVIEGLMSEMAVKDADGNTVGLDTKKLNSKRLKTLFTFIDQFEKRAFGNPSQRVEHEGSVDVRHVVAQVRQGLIEAED